MYAYIDESGDIGYTDKSSKYFILTAIIVEDNLELERDIRAYMSKLLKINKNRSHYFHAYRDNLKIRNKLLQISEEHVKRCLVIDLEKNKYTNYRECLEEMINLLKNIGVTNVKVARHTTNNKFEDKIREIFREIKISFSFAKDNKGLQVADLYSYIVYSNLRGQPDEIYKNVTHKIEIIKI